jgi:tRNA(Ile)-lysidine synthase TilS/MesJ
LHHWKGSSQILKYSYLKWFKGKVKRAVTDYEMIKDGDRVAVGLSGGKDSMALLHVLQLIRGEIPVAFEVQGLFVDPGWPVEVQVLEEFCRERGIAFTWKKTNIAEVVFDERNEKNPCALCANLRRGALNNAARDIGCNKVALGHHLDDAIETFFMSLFYTGQFRTFSPRTYMDRSELTLIRPLVYHTQRTVQNFVDRENLPVIVNPCPVSGKTKREEIKEVVHHLVGLYPELRTRFLTALQTMDPNNLWPLPRPRNIHH